MIIPGRKMFDWCSRDRQRQSAATTRRSRPSSTARVCASCLVRLLLIAGGLVAKAVDLQLLDDGFLEGQGDARFTRIAKLSANRGGIYDRNGEALAASMPVDTVWACHAR